MFASLKTYLNLQPTFLKKPSSNNSSNNNKENFHSNLIERPHQRAQYDEADHLNPFNNPKAQFAEPQIHSARSDNTGQNHEYTEMLQEMASKRRLSSRGVGNTCRHSNIKKYKRVYCKDCGIFIPKTGAVVYREQSYKQKIDNHPDEVYRIMLENQGKNRQYSQRSPHLEYRKTLVDWIYELGDELKFTMDTIYSAISYLDTVLLKVHIPKNKLQLISICCLITAAKFFEKEEDIPSYSDISKNCRGAFSVEHFKKTEMVVLEMLDWNLKTISTFQFVQFYLSKGCAFSTDRSVVRDIDSKLLRYLRKYSEFFSDISLHEYEFNSYKANVFACSAIAGARKAVGLLPIWNSELEELSEVTWEEIEPCFKKLYSSFEVAFPEVAKKVSAYTEPKEKEIEIADLRESYAAMSIETTNTPPIRQANWRGNQEVDISSKKQNQPSPFQQKAMINQWTTVGNMGSHSANQANIERKPIKMVDDDKMNIENMCEELIKRDTNERVKRNLAF